MNTMNVFDVIKIVRIVSIVGIFAILGAWIYAASFGGAKSFHICTWLTLFSAPIILICAYFCNGILAEKEYNSNKDYYIERISDELNLYVDENDYVYYTDGAGKPISPVMTHNSRRRVEAYQLIDVHDVERLRYL